MNFVDDSDDDNDEGCGYEDAEQEAWREPEYVTEQFSGTERTHKLVDKYEGSSSSKRRKSAMKKVTDTMQFPEDHPVAIRGLGFMDAVYELGKTQVRWRVHGGAAALVLGKTCAVCQQQPTADFCLLRFLSFLFSCPCSTSCFACLPMLGPKINPGGSCLLLHRLPAELVTNYDPNGRHCSRAGQRRVFALVPQAQKIQSGKQWGARKPGEKNTKFWRRGRHQLTVTCCIRRCCESPMLHSTLCPKHVLG